MGRTQNTKKNKKQSILICFFNKQQLNLETFSSLVWGSCWASSWRLSDECLTSSGSNWKGLNYCESQMGSSLGLSGGRQKHALFLLPLSTVFQKINMLNENQVPLAWQQNKEDKARLLLHEEITLKGNCDFNIGICYGCQLIHSLNPISENIIDSFSVTIPASGMC